MGKPTKLKTVNGYRKLVLDASNYSILASVKKEESSRYSVHFELDPSKQISQLYSCKTYKDVLNFASKVLPILEVAKRTDDALINLYFDTWGIIYKGAFNSIVDHYFNALILDSISLNDIVNLTFEFLKTYWENEHLDSRLKLTNNYGVFIENEFMVEQFLQEQYEKNKDMEIE